MKRLFTWLKGVVENQVDFATPYLGNPQKDQNLDTSFLFAWSFWPK
jgi:hypothetical protein